MISGITSLTIQKGFSFRHSFGFAYDISDMNFIGKVKDVRDEIIANFTIVKDDPSKRIFLSLDSTKTNLINSDHTFYIQQIDSSGYDPVIIRGTIQIETV
jgi:hypothetical protein